MQYVRQSCRKKKNNVYQLHSNNIHQLHNNITLRRGHVVAQLVEALHYQQEGRGFDSKFFMDTTLPAAPWHWYRLNL